MDRSELVRRAFHLTSPAWLAWYWIPSDAWIGVPKMWFLLLFLCGALLIEAARLFAGSTFTGMRAYEKDRLSAYAWGSLGLALGLVFFPGEIVIVTFCGMAWVDPLCGYTRKRGGWPILPLIVYVVLAIALWTLVVPTAPFQTSPISPWRAAAYAPLAAVIAIAVERPNLRDVDDDFLMHVAPMLALAGISRLA